MAQRDLLKRYLDAGLAFTQMTKSKAEGIVREMVKAGDVERDQVQSRVEDLIDRSRRNTDHLIALVRKEVTSQLADLGLATRRDREKLERRSRETSGPEAIATGAPAGTKAAPKKARVADKSVTATPTEEAAPVRKAKPAAKRGPAKKPAAAAEAPSSQKAPAKRAPAPAEAPGAQKAPAKRAPAAKKVAAKKVAAKKATGAQRPASPGATRPRKSLPAQPSADRRPSADGSSAPAS